MTVIEPEHVWYRKLIETEVPHLVQFKHGFDVTPSAPPNHLTPPAYEGRRCPSRLPEVGGGNIPKYVTLDEQ